MNILAQVHYARTGHGRLIRAMRSYSPQTDPERPASGGGYAMPLEPWEGPAILLVDLDAFFASVEQLDHPAWRGKPVIVGGDADKHGVVSTASYEARPYGVRSAMPSSTAKRLCPHAIWTHGRFDRYREMSNAIMDILRAETPHVQQVSIDEAFMDVSPTSVNREHPVRVAQRIQQRVEELGVTCSIGVGTSKTVAKIASDMDKPRGLTVVHPGGERDFLAPLPVRTMSGIGAAAEEKLHSRGIRTLGQLADADEGMLLRAFGKNGRVMHVRANGGDDAPVEQDDTVKSVSNEMTFAVDLTTREDVEGAIATIAAKVGRRLRRKGLRGRTLGLRMRYDDRSVRSVQRQLPAPSDDELSYTPLLYRMAKACRAACSTSPRLLPATTMWTPSSKTRRSGADSSRQPTSSRTSSANPRSASAASCEARATPPAPPARTRPTTSRHYQSEAGRKRYAAANPSRKPA